MSPDVRLLNGLVILRELTFEFEGVQAVVARVLDRELDADPCVQLGLRGLFLLF